MAWPGSTPMRWLLLASAALASGCRGASPPPPAEVRPSILLVTLDTTRADADRPGGRGRRDAGVQRPRRARPALPPGVRDGARDAAVPRSMHDRALPGRPRRARERARRCRASRPSLAERLRQAGYRTAAFVSELRAGAALRARARLRRLRRRAAGRPGRAERRPRDDRTRARATCGSPASRAAASSGSTTSTRTHPYAPPEPFRPATRTSPYLGEVAAMDAQLGRLVAGVRSTRGQGRPRSSWSATTARGSASTARRSTASSLYQATMHVPLVLVGPGVAPGVGDAPVSTRRVFHTLLDWAGLEAADSLRAPTETRSSSARR